MTDFFIYLISHPITQTIFTCITIFLAFLTILLTYKLSRPKIRCKVFSDKGYLGKDDAIFSSFDNGTTATVHITFTNDTSHKTQIRNACIIYKKHLYHAANIYADYSSLAEKFVITKKDKKAINQNLLLAKVPFTMDSFESKNLYLTFFDLPEIKKTIFLAPLIIRITGKTLPKVLLVSFSRIKTQIKFPKSFIFKNKMFTTVVKTYEPLKKYSAPQITHKEH